MWLATADAISAELARPDMLPERRQALVEAAQDAYFAAAAVYVARGDERYSAALAHVTDAAASATLSEAFAIAWGDAPCATDVAPDLDLGLSYWQLTDPVAGACQLMADAALTDSQRLTLLSTAPRTSALSVGSLLLVLAARVKHGPQLGADVTDWAAAIEAWRALLDSQPNTLLVWNQEF
jgi:hypothetical protein